LELLIEKRPAVSAERLTTSSPKRDGVVLESVEDGVLSPFETSVPDQQVVIKDQKVMKREALRRCLGISLKNLKQLMSKGIIGLYKVRFTFSREDFSVWE
jgi:hypothetical protein